MHSALAQTSIRGAVFSEVDRKALEGAFVVALSENTQIAFTYSDCDGVFNLVIPAGAHAEKIRISMIGFKPETLLYRDSEIKDVFLQEQHFDLNASIIRSEPVKLHGDTLSFNVRAFSDNNEKVLADLLNKIPGLSVTESGGILHNGSYINRFYVEGLDLMGNRYGIVAKNLPANRVAGVELYQHHQPVRALENAEPTDKSAVNIILNTSARGSWLFSADGSVGAPGLPLFEDRLLLSRFETSSQSLFLLKGNNIGNDIIPELKSQSYFGRTGVFRIIPGSLEADLQTMLSPGRLLLPLPKEYWFDNISGIGSVNTLRRLGNDSFIRFYIQMGAESLNERKTSSESVVLPDGGELTITDNDTRKDALFFISGGAYYEYNGLKRFLSDHLSYSIQIRDVNSVLDGYDAFIQKYDLPSFKVENKLNAIIGGEKKDAVLRFNSESSIVSNNHSALYETDSEKYSQFIRAQDILTDNVFSKGVKVSGHLLNFSAGLLLGHVGRDISLDGPVSQGSLLSVSEIQPHFLLSGSVVHKRSRLWFGIPASVMYLGIKGKDNIVYPSCSPSLFLEQQISNKVSFSANLTYELLRSSAESLSGVYVMKNYRTLSKPDSLGCKGSFNSRAALRYTDLATLFFATVSMTYSYYSLDRAVSSTYKESLICSEYLPEPVTSSNYGVNLRAEKIFDVKTLALVYDGGMVHSEREETLQGKMVRCNDDLFKSSFSVRINPFDWFSLSSSIKYSLNILESTRSVRVKTCECQANLVLKPFQKFSIRTDLSYLLENAADIVISNPLLMKSGFEYSLNRIKLFVDCYNLFDAREYRREYFTSFGVISSATALNARRIIAGVRMTL